MRPIEVSTIAYSAEIEATKQQSVSTVAQANLTDTIYLTDNVLYGYLIEFEAYSKAAPNGMVLVNTAKWNIPGGIVETALGNAKLLVP